MCAVIPPSCFHYPPSFLLPLSVLSSTAFLFLLPLTVSLFLSPRFLNSFFPFPLPITLYPSSPLTLFITLSSPPSPFSSSSTSPLLLLPPSPFTTTYPSPFSHPLSFPLPHPPPSTPTSPFLFNYYFPLPLLLHPPSPSPLFHPCYRILHSSPGLAQVCNGLTSALVNCKNARS